MKKKTIITLTIALILIGALGIGSTLAYFTDTEEVSNVITMGKVNITLTEKNDGDPEDITITGMTFEDILPGDNLKKDPQVNLEEDSKDAYVAVLITVSNDADEEDEAFAADLDALYNSIVKGMTEGEDAKWILNSDNKPSFTVAEGEKDNYIYFKEKMSQDNPTAVLFKEVNIPSAWGNECEGKEFSIEITAVAIQADNYTPWFEASND